MAAFKFNDVPVEAGVESEAAEKLRYALVLTRHFKVHELKKLAEVVEKQPLKVAFAKKALGL
jgi:hypothetical protein